MRVNVFQAGDPYAIECIMGHKKINIKVKIDE